MKLKLLWHSRAAILALSTALPLLAQPAESKPKLTAGQVSGLTKQLGASGTKLYLSWQEYDLPSSGLPLDERSAEVEDLLKRYEARRQAYSAVSNLNSYGTIATATVAAVGATVLTGGAALPVAVAGVLGATGFQLNGRFLDSSEGKVADAMVYEIGTELVMQTGMLDLAQFRGKPEELRQLVEGPLRESDAYLADVKARAQAIGDQRLVDTTIDVVITRLALMDEAQLRAAEANAASITDLSERFSLVAEHLHQRLVKTEVTLDRHEQNITELQAGMVALGGAIVAMDAQIQTLGRNQTLIADFAFSRMSPREKADALRNGLLDGRIRCPKDQSDCDVSEIKTAMITRYEADADLQDNIETAGNVLKGIHDARQIAANLGIELGKDAELALNVGTAALGAYVQFQSGNPLGAVASLTSLFGNRPDPDQQRFEAMMGFMRQQFGLVNAKLDTVLENQQAIMDGIVDLSEQIEASHNALDEKLNRIDWLQQKMDANIKQLLWRDWQGCNAVYRFALKPDEQSAPLVNLKTLRFHNFEALRDTIQSKGDDARACRATISRSRASLFDTASFGNFLGTTSAFSDDEAAAHLTPEEFRDLGDIRSAAQRFTQDVIAPQNRILFAWLARRHIDPATALFAFTMPLTGADDLAIVSRWLEDGQRYACPVLGQERPEDLGRYAISGLVCGPQVNTQGLASEYLSASYSTDVLTEITRWSLVSAQLLDLYSGATGNFELDLVKLADNSGNFPVGRSMVNAALDLATLGHAFQERIFGGLMGQIVFEDLSNGRANPDHALALTSNPYLAQNVAMLMLRAARANEPIIDGSAGPSFLDRYYQAYLMASDPEAPNMDGLRALFGAAMRFAQREDGSPTLILDIAGQNPALPLPGPQQLIEARFTVPQNRDTLLADRAVLVDWLAEYDLVDDPDLALLLINP